ncbi:MAG: hypothetical protein KDB39_19890, partial [Austwickia sp.]|nr:hypothetical protein [Austwickia sp.]
MTSTDGAGLASTSCGPIWPQRGTLPITHASGARAMASAAAFTSVPEDGRRSTTHSATTSPASAPATPAKTPHPRMKTSQGHRRPARR